MSDEYGSDDDSGQSNYSMGGATTGTEGEDSDMFGEDFEPMDVLQTMEQQEPGSASGLQPYQVLTRRASTWPGDMDNMDEDAAAGPSSSGKDAFGADMDELMDPNVAEELGLAPKRRRGRRRRRRKGKSKREIPEHVAKMLGEANVYYATKGYPKAHALLLEVVRQAPNWADPWYTLGMVFEGLGDAKKALNVFMIAAHLTKKDAGFWRRLADMSVELGFVNQAVYCFTKAIHRDKGNADLRYDRAVLYAELGQASRAIVEMEMVRKQEPNHPQVPVQLARLYHRLRQPAKAIEVLESYLKQCKEEIDPTQVNILAELYMDQGSFHEAISLILKVQQAVYTGDPLPPDLMIKAGMCHLQLGSHEEANEQLVPLLEQEVQHFADLYLDAGMAYLKAGVHAMALQFLEPLLDVPEYNTPQVWTSITSCYKATGAAARGVALFEAQLSLLQPDHMFYMEAVLSLGQLLADAGQGERVQELLHHMDDLMQRQQVALPGDPVEKASLLARRQALYLSLGDSASFIDSMLPSITDSLAAMEVAQRTTDDKALRPELRRALQRRERRLASGKSRSKQPSQRDLQIFEAGHSKDRRKKHVRELDAEADELMSQAESEGEGRGGRGKMAPNGVFATEQSFEMFCQCCHALIQSGRALEAKQLLQRAIKVCKATRGNLRPYRHRMRLLLTEALAGNEELQAAVLCLSQVISRDADNREAWNLFCRLFTHAGTLRQWTRFVHNVRSRNPTCLVPAIMQGHSYLLKRQYQHALTEYLVALRAVPGEPLLLLCCGAAYHGMAASKNVPDRHRAVLMGFAFFQEYGRARDLRQEGYYNQARAAHGLGLLFIAEEMYKKALAAPPAQASTAPKEGAVPAASLDLRREAAFNLHLIYRSSGADELAREVLQQHFVV